MDLQLTQKAVKESAKFVDLLVMEGVPRDRAARYVQAFALKIAGKRKRATVSPTAASGFQAVIDEFTRLYQQWHHEEPVLREDDFAAVRTLQRFAPAGKIIMRLSDYFKWDDEFVMKAGHSLRSFLRNWNRLAAYLQQHAAKAQSRPPGDCKHQPPCLSGVEHSRRFLQEVGQ